jgi:hypothetical protein
MEFTFYICGIRADYSEHRNFSIKASRLLQDRTEAHLFGGLVIGFSIFY